MPATVTSNCDWYVSPDVNATMSPYPVGVRHGGNFIGCATATATRIQVPSLGCVIDVQSLALVVGMSWINTWFAPPAGQLTVSLGNGLTGVSTCPGVPASFSSGTYDGRLAFAGITIQ